MLSSSLKKYHPSSASIIKASTRCFAANEKPQSMTTFEQIQVKLTPWVWNRWHNNPSNLPTVAQRKPFRVELTPGETYMWCTCGQSKN